MRRFQSFLLRSFFGAFHYKYFPEQKAPYPRARTELLIPELFQSFRSFSELYFYNRSFWPELFGAIFSEQKAPYPRARTELLIPEQKAPGTLG